MKETNLDSRGPVLSLHHHKLKINAASMNTLVSTQAGDLPTVRGVIVQMRPGCTFQVR